MSDTTPTDESLRAAFAERPVETDLDAESLDEIWAAVHGETSLETRAAWLARARSEPAVAEAWRVAAAVGTELGTAPLAQTAPQPTTDEPAPTAPVVRGPSSWWRRPALVVGALAAAAAAAVVVQVQTRPLDPDPMRADTSVLSSLQDPATPIPRADATLTWVGAPGGSTYSVTVTTAELAPVASVGGLTTPRWTVPEASLQALPAGTRLLWRVEARAPEGDRLRSPTFEAVLE